VILMFGRFPGWRQRMMMRRQMVRRSRFGCCALVALGIVAMPVGAFAVVLAALRRLG
jgi:hypothetical protein